MAVRRMVLRQGLIKLSKLFHNLTAREMKDILWYKEIESQSGKEHDEWSGRVDEINSQRLKEANPWRILKMGEG